jgi:predicted ribosome quality control (RQC) complex YloA/Tae2 family protein
MKFRQIQISSGKEVFGGKDAKTNEKLIEQSQENEFLFHTKLPGSPFCNIKSDFKEVSKRDIKETAIFCARYSQDWRDNQKDVTVQYFLGKDVYKLKSMKLGTFGVRNTKEIKIKRQEVVDFLSKEKK